MSWSRFHPSPVALLCLLALAPICPLHAQEQSAPVLLEPIVVSATLKEQAVSETPSSVQVIGQEQIQQMGAESVAQALEEAIGMSLSSESGRVVQPSIRGTGALHTLVLIDGRRPAPGFRGMTDINHIPTVMIERIEIIRGPSSALYGSDAIGGVINIITKSPPREGTEACLDAKTGSNARGGGGAFLPQGYLGSSLGPARFILGGEYMKKNGWEYDNVAPDDGDHLERAYVSGQAAVDLGKQHSVSFGGYHGNFERTGERELQSKLTERETTERSREVFLRYDAALAEKRKLMLQAYQTHYSIGANLTPNIPDPYTANDEEYTRTQYEGRFSTELNKNILATVGAEYREDQRGDDTLTPKHANHNLASFGQLDMTFLERLNLVAGARWDEHSEFGSEVSPRLSMKWAFNDYLALKGGFGTGFRAPSSYELYVTSYRRQGKDIYQANTDLEAETSQTYEVGLQAKLPVSKGLELEANYFNTEIDNLIDSVLKSRTKSGYVYKYENISEAKINGVELIGSQRLPHGWRLGASVTLLDPKNEETGQQLASQARTKCNANVQWHIASLGLKLRTSYTWYNGVEDGAGGSLDDASSLDLWAGKDVGKGMQLYAGVKNLLDDESSTYSVSPQFYYLGLRWTY